MEEIFFQLAAILVIAFLVSYFERLLKQPIIIGYIIAGIIVSPFLIQFGATKNLIDIFSKIGIAFLLFIVGLHLNPKVIKEIGIKSLLIGLLQMILTFSLSFIISFKLLSFDFVSSTYIGIALALSSTIIVTKLLSDKKQLDSLYGKISIGILIIQDLVAILALMFISSINQGNDFGVLAFKTLLLGIGLVAGSFLFGYFILLKFIKSVARSQELLFLFSICWCFLVAALFAFLGFSIEIGALIAGIILSVSPYSTEISSKIKPIRDFFLIIFFIILGLNINLPSIKDVIFNALILSCIALILKPIILMGFMALFNYTKKTNFLVGISLAQISEFSLIILMLGVSLGHLSVEILYTLTLTLIITILCSTYLSLYSRKIYKKMFKIISIFEKKKIKKNRKNFKKSYTSVLFGYNRTGFEVLKSLTKLKKPYLVIDFNPDTIVNLNKFRVPCLYGDIDDPELLEELHLDKIDLAISTIPDFEENSLLIESIRLVNPDVIIIARANEINEALELYKKGADYILTPQFLGGGHVASMINNLKTNKKGYEREKEKHIKLLEEVLKKSKGKLRISKRAFKKTLEEQS
jgi:Kef-type K+ transport system membrane component KefB/Trk K+ transport system NAD-binding subunit